MSDRFYCSEKEEDFSKKRTQYKHPDKIIIGEEQDDFCQNSFNEKKQSAQQKVFINRKIFSPRLLSCLGFFCSFLFGGFVLIGSLPSLFFAALFLFRSQPLNQVVKKLWKLSSNALVVSAGFLLGILSPSLGFSCILLYLSWHAGQNQFTQMIRRLFS